MVSVKTKISSLVTESVLAAISVLALGASGFPITTPQSFTPDSFILSAAKPFFAFLVCFSVLHFIAQKTGFKARIIYAGFGIVAFSLAVATVFDSIEMSKSIESGIVSLYVAVVLVLGAMMGFLYHVNAGYDTQGDDPESLARALENNQYQPDQGAPVINADRLSRYGISPQSSAPKNSSSSVSTDGSLVNTSTAEYFDGPIQVRTSIGAAFMAAIAATVLYSIGTVVFSLFDLATGASSSFLSDLQSSLGEAAKKVPQIPQDPAELATSLQRGSSILLSQFFYGLLTSPFYVLLIMIGHYIARARNKTDYFQYAVIGLILPPVIGLIAFIGFVIVGLGAAVPTALGMIMYRKYAGLEPKPVKEDIEVRERRDLVGANHARRQFGRVIAKN